MAAKSLNLGLHDFHVGHHDTLTITFQESGTFCSPDADHFTPPLPHGVFFKKGERWPATGEATPTGKNANTKTRYTFHQSSGRVPCRQRTGVDDSGGPSTDHVIHVP
jgi:hypothetical protein